MGKCSSGVFGCKHVLHCLFWGGGGDSSLYPLFRGDRDPDAVYDVEFPRKVAELRQRGNFTSCWGPVFHTVFVKL